MTFLSEIGNTTQNQRTEIVQQTPKSWIHTSKGKGRIVPRKSYGSDLAPIQSLPQKKTCDSRYGEMPTDPPPRYEASLGSQWVPYFSMDVIQSAYKAINTMWERCPALLQNSGFLTERLGFDTLPQATQNCTSFDILSSDCQRHRFIECDVSKNDLKSSYYIRETETQKLQDMDIENFVQCARAWTTRKLMLKTQFQSQANTSTNAKEGSNLDTYVDWEWLSALCQSLSIGPIRNYNVYASTLGAFELPRYSVNDEIFLQMSGRSRILLIGPEWAFNGMYTYPTSHPYDGYSMVDIESPDAGKWPGCGMIQGKSVIVNPGDVLYIPSYFFMAIQHLENENVSLRIDLHPSSKRGIAKNALPLHISRAIEARVESVVGQRDVKTWLQLIASGKELEKIDLGTVSGYHRAVMCQGVRDEIEESLGQGAWSDFLRAMCRGRLTPTPWLNQNYRNSLLLKYSPVLIEDTRSEEEKKYPTLFRRKLQADGWTVTPTPSTVPIPGVNIPA